MADSNVPITAGSGTTIDTFTQAGGDHRQAMVLGDAVNADVAGVANGGLGVNGGALVTTSGAIAAGGTGTIGPLNVATSGNVSFIIRNTVAASAWAGFPIVAFEQSDDNTSWSPLIVVRNDTGQAMTTAYLSSGLANGAMVFEAALEAVQYVRARVTTGPITNGFTIDIQAGGMPFPQGNGIIAIPSDGFKNTYSAASTPLTPHITGTTTQPWFTLPNASTTGVLVRIIRLRLELTIATAALVSVALIKNFPPHTGGTTNSLQGVSHDRNATATGGIPPQLYTAAPTANSSPLLVGARRAWVPVNTATTGPAVMEWTWGNRPGKAMAVPPNWMFGVAWITAPATAITASVELEWTEEPA